MSMSDSNAKMECYFLSRRGGGTHDSRGELRWVGNGERMRGIPTTAKNRRVEEQLNITVYFARAKL